MKVDIDKLSEEDGFPESLVRGSEWDLSYKCWCSLPSKKAVEGDHKALSQLLSIRLEQRKALFNGVEEKLKKSHDNNKEGSSAKRIKIS